MITYSFISFCIAWVLINILHIDKYNITKRKPFNCEPCLSFWIGLIVGLIYSNPIMVAFTSCFFGAVITHIIDKR